MTRRNALALLGATLARAADRLPANRNVKWGLGSNLWNYFPRVPFTDILDVMKDTGFIGLRVTQFPQILNTYGITAAQMQKEAEKRGCHIVTISFNGPTHDPARRADTVANARTAMTFLKEFGASHLVVFSPNRSNAAAPGAFQAMCECFNAIGAAANEMGFRAGLHNHVGQIVETPEEVDRCMAMTDPKLFHFSPDTAHLHLAGCDVAKTLEKHKARLMLADYKDAKRAENAKPDTFDRNTIFDLGDGEIDFVACHRVLKSMGFQGWLIVDLDIARQGPRASYERCGAYVVKSLEPVYA
ncbi:Xylose isomerase domain protein TIM barrel [Candidatus Sulfopaludibacter sp. SbA3]|nr:Xylose isomerase domain protein TIM barrel [Candidatus Sulfopaludibacter sp. SbA3]